MTLVVVEEEEEVEAPTLGVLLSKMEERDGEDDADRTVGEPQSAVLMLLACRIRWTCL